VTKHLDSNTKHLEVLLCYDLTKGVTYKEEEILFVIKPDLFIIGTTTLLELEILNAIIFNAEIDTKEITFKFPHFEGYIQMDTTPTHIRIQDLDIACWTLHEDHQVQTPQSGNYQQPLDNKTNCNIRWIGYYKH
jgi:hypothetical protein